MEKEYLNIIATLGNPIITIGVAYLAYKWLNLKFTEIDKRISICQTIDMCQEKHEASKERIIRLEEAKNNV